MSNKILYAVKVGGLVIALLNSLSCEAEKNWQTNGAINENAPSEISEMLDDLDDRFAQDYTCDQNDSGMIKIAVFDGILLMPNRYEIKPGVVTSFTSLSLFTDKYKDNLVAQRMLPNRFNFNYINQVKKTDVNKPLLDKIASLTEQYNRFHYELTYSESKFNPGKGKYELYLTDGEQFMLWRGAESRNFKLVLDCFEQINGGQ